jgi:2-polyprenyl-3-methyl-5-hydroxy-6-metoxy-1,4-benzoquinol methylase
MSEAVNIHIGRRKLFKHYHHVVQRLVTQYTEPGGQVLDIGCGMGHLLSLIRDADRGYELTGADAFQVCLDGTAELVPEASRLLVHEEGLDMETLRKGAPYDAVTMIHTLEHTLSPAETVRSALELVRPGGHLFLAVPNPVRPKNVLNALRRHHYVNRGHVCAWDRSHWMNFLDTILGLDVVEYSQDEVRLFPSRIASFAPLKAIEIGVSNVVPWWSFTNIAVIRR